jgi:3-methylcrotonyl-CoA carboxylase alpha subunit
MFIMKLVVIVTAWNIRFVEDKKPFYQAAQVPTFKLTCENFEYSNQAIAGFRLNGDRNHKAVLSVDGIATEVDIPIVEYVDPRPFVFSQNAPSGFFQTGNGQTWWVEPYRYAGGAHASAHDGDILSPMPGRIIAVDVAAGQAVTKGQKLLTLEAMKMEHSLTAPFDGVVAELNAEAGAQVQVEALLVRIEAVEEK